MSVTVHHGDCLDVLRGMAEASVDSVVTDPPAGISFMSKAWDGDKGGRDAWVAWMREVAAECLRVAKPGAHALVWALPRTSHWTATAWEDAGWTVRDRVSHIFGTGFPKSADMSKHIDKMAGAEREVVGFDHEKAARFEKGLETQNPGWERPWMREPGAVERRGRITAPATDAAKQWQGFGTALKPAVEDWWLLRKPLACPTVAAQVLATGTGALNVDGCRVGIDDGEREIIDSRSGADHGGRAIYGSGIVRPEGERFKSHVAGRWPANLCHDGSPEVLEAFGRFGESKSPSRPVRQGGKNIRGFDVGGGSGPDREGFGIGYGDEGSPARFFPALGFGENELRFHYSAKASKADRAGSRHPTIKPVALMRWLCRLVTPPGGVVLDPFAGSGTTGEAALREGFSAVLIEREAEYVADIRARLARHRDEAPLLAEVAA